MPHTNPSTRSPAPSIIAISSNLSSNSISTVFNLMDNLGFSAVTLPTATRPSRTAQSTPVQLFQMPFTVCTTQSLCSRHCLDFSTLHQHPSVPPVIYTHKSELAHNRPLTVKHALILTTSEKSTKICQFDRNRSVLILY